MAEQIKANSKENSFCFVFVKLRGKFILCYFAYVYVASENLTGESVLSYNGAPIWYASFTNEIFG